MDRRRTGQPVRAADPAETASGQSGVGCIRVSAAKYPYPPHRGVNSGDTRAGEGDAPCEPGGCLGFKHATPPDAGFREPGDIQRSIRRRLLLGAVGQAACHFARVAAGPRINAGTASLLLAAIPVFTVLSARLPRRGWLGILVALAGTSLVSIGDAARKRLELRALLALAAAACPPTLFVFQKSWLCRCIALATSAYGVWSGLTIALFARPETIWVAAFVLAPALLGAASLGVVPTAMSTPCGPSPWRADRQAG